MLPFSIFHHVVKAIKYSYVAVSCFRWIFLEYLSCLDKLHHEWQLQKQEEENIIWSFEKKINLQSFEENANLFRLPLVATKNETAQKNMVMS